MENLIKIIERYYERRIVDESLSEDEQTELDYLESFIKSFDINDTKSVFGFDPMKYLVSSIASRTDGRNFGLLVERLQIISPRLLTSTDYSETAEINNILARAALDKCLHLIESLPFLDDYNDDSLEIIQELKEKGKLEEAISLHKMLKHYITTEQERKDLFDLFKQYQSTLFKALNSIAVINSTAIRCNYRRDEKIDIMPTPGGFDFKKPIIPPSSGTSMSVFDFNSKEARRSFRQLLEVCYVIEFYNSIQERISYLKRIPDQRYRENSNNRRKKEKLISQIKTFDLSKIIEPSRAFIESISDEKIKYFVLKEIMIHNSKFHQKTKFELLKENELTELEKVFKKSCFSFNSLTEEQKNNLLTYGNIEDIKKMLNILTESDLKFTKDFPIYDILLLSKPSIVSAILKLRSANIISESLIMSSKEIFVKEIDEELIDKTTIQEGKFDTLLMNLNSLSNHNLSTESISRKEKDIILMDNKRLEKSLQLVDLYNLDYSSSNSYELIKDNKLIVLVDKFIELGLGEYIKEHPHQISERCIPRINRMYLCKQLNIPLLIDNKLNPKITAVDFEIGKNVISDDDITEFIPNSVNRYLNEECFKALIENNDYTNFEGEISLIEEYKTSEIEYNFEGIIISRNKVLRNYKCLKEKCPSIDDKALLFNAILFESILDEEQIEIINNIINKKEAQIKTKNC